LTPPDPDSQLAVEWSSHHLNRQPLGQIPYVREARLACKITCAFLVYSLLLNK